MNQKKLSYLCPQAEVISLGARENFCQSSSTDVNLGTGNIIDEMEISPITW